MRFNFLKKKVNFFQKILNNFQVSFCHVQTLFYHGTFDLQLVPSAHSQAGLLVLVLYILCLMQNPSLSLALSSTQMTATDLGAR